MKELTGNLVLVYINNTIEKRLVLIFKDKKSKFLLKYATNKDNRISRDVDILLNKPIKLEDIRGRSPFNCGICKLGNFSGSRFSSISEPKIFLFNSNIMIGSWKIYIDEKDHKTYILRMA